MQEWISITNVASASLNSFGSKPPEAGFESPLEEQLITLTYGQLRDLITQAVEKAIQPLRDRIEYLESTVASQDEEIAALKADIKLDSQDIRDLYQHVDALISKPPERAPPEPFKKTTSHIDELHRLMIEEKSQQVSIAKGARLLGISKERMRQLKPLIMQDGRFEMGWSTIKGKKAAVIRIRRFL